MITFYRFRLPLSLAGLSLLFLLSLSTSHTAQAAVYKCQVADKTVYQATPCANGKQTVLKTTKHDTGLHATWFARPPLLPDSASCDSQACRCGKQTLPLSSNIHDNVEKSLTGLINDWQQHHTLYSSYLTLTSEEQKTATDRPNIADAACMINMHQTVIKQSYLTVINPQPVPTIDQAALKDKLAELCAKEIAQDTPLNKAKALYEQCLREHGNKLKNELTPATSQPTGPQFPTQVATLKLKNPYVID